MNSRRRHLDDPQWSGASEDSTGTADVVETASSVSQTETVESRLSNHSLGIEDSQDSASEAENLLSGDRALRVSSPILETNHTPHSDGDSHDNGGSARAVSGGRSPDVLESSLPGSPAWSIGTEQIWDMDDTRQSRDDSEASGHVENSNTGVARFTSRSNPEAPLSGAEAPPSRHRRSSTSRETRTPVLDTMDKSSEEPPVKIRRTTSPTPDTDGETCPICLEIWATSGDHRLVALRCGHLFGYQCVLRWLRAQKAKDRTCPTCKTTANLKDIIFIYARKLIAADTSQITQLQKQIEVLQSEKSKVELELQKSIITHRACVQQLEVLRSTLMKTQIVKEQPIRRSWRFALEKNMEISKDGGCRVLTYNCRTYELYVSQKSTNNLFPGYGIRKVSCVDYKLGQFMHLHPKPIRDINYSQPRDLLLSVALDSSARIVDRGAPSATIQAGFPLWSCSWDFLRTNEFYVGGVGGVIHHYDVRNPSTFIQRMANATDMSPVVSLCSTEYGLLSCQLNSCWLWVNQTRQWEPRAMPIDGPFMSLCYDSDSHRALIASRPGSNSLERSRLTLCKLKPSVNNGEILFDLEHTFHGSTKSSVMSRPAWVKAPGASWVAAHSESESMLYLHGLDSSKTISLLGAEPVLDVCSVQINGDTILAALSESRLRLYKSIAQTYRV